jgi:hypothetical protein
MCCFFQLVIFRIVTPSDHAGEYQRSDFTLLPPLSYDPEKVSPFLTSQYLIFASCDERYWGPEKGCLFLQFRVAPVTKKNMDCPGFVSSTPVLCLSDVANLLRTPHPWISRWGQEVPSKCRYLRKRQHGVTIRSPQFALYYFVNKQSMIERQLKLL